MSDLGSPIIARSGGEDPEIEIGIFARFIENNRDRSVLWPKRCRCLLFSPA
jgi:hypothetical protein